MSTYPAEIIDANDQVRAGLEIGFTDDTNQPAALNGDGVFSNVTPYSITDASAAAIITGLATLGLFVDNT